MKKEWTLRKKTTAKVGATCDKKKAQAKPEKFCSIDIYF